jgi:hypothetical protein
MNTRGSAIATSSNRGSGADSTDHPRSLGVLPWVNLVAFLVHAGTDMIVSSLGFPSVPEMAAKYQSLVTPIGWAFLIELLVLVIQALSVGVQMAASARILHLPAPLMQSIVTVRYQYAWTALFQLGWTLSFASEHITLSPIMMLATLWSVGSAVKGLTQAPNNIRHIDGREQSQSAGWRIHYFLFQFPLVIYCGWILVGMVVNPNIVLVAHNLGTDVTLTCSVVGLSILAVAALGLNGAYGLVEIPLVMAWALLGIYAELIVPQASIREAYSQTQLDGIRTGTLAAAVGIVVVVVHDTFRRITVSFTMGNGGVQGDRDKSK